MKLSPAFREKLHKFKQNKRAYYSAWILLVLSLLSLPAEVFFNDQPLILSVDGKWYFPFIKDYAPKDFGEHSTVPITNYTSTRFMNFLNGTQTAVTAADIFGDGEDRDDLGEGPPAPSRQALPPAPETRRGSPPRQRDFWFLWAPVRHSHKSRTENPKCGREVLAAPYLDYVEMQQPWFKDTFRGSLRITDKNGATAIIDLAAAKSLEDILNAINGNQSVSVTAAPDKSGDKFVITGTSGAGKLVIENVFKSSWLDQHYLGTDKEGKDVLARIVYGFRISMIFGLGLALSGTIVGALLGAIQGYFGGGVDLIGQRLTEIWGSIPRLFLLIILSSFLANSLGELSDFYHFLLLFGILNLTAWMGMAAYMRAEFLKARNLEYVKAARALGLSDFKIMGRHILPNSLTPIITFFPFEITAGILALVSLDFLALGVKYPAPSLGELLKQGQEHLHALWIILPTFCVLVLGITLLTFIGDGTRDAFDPRSSAS